MSNMNRILLPLAAAGALAGGEVAPAAEKSIAQQHVEYCVDLYAGNTDNVNQAGELKPDGQKDGLPGSTGYDFVRRGTKVSVNVDPQNLKADFENCNDVEIDRTAVAKVYDKRGDDVRTIARVAFTLDAEGSQQDKKVFVKRPRAGSTNFMKLFVTATSGDYTAKSVVKTAPVKSYE